LPRTLSQKALLRLILWGLVLIPLANAADVIMDTVLFGEGTVTQQLLSPSSQELAMRVLFSVFILAAVYLGMHYLANTAERERALHQRAEDLDRARQDLEDFNHDLLQQLRNTSSEISTSMSLLQTQRAQELDDKTLYFLEAVGTGHAKLNRQLEIGCDLMNLPLHQPQREHIKVDKLALEIRDELIRRHPDREIEFSIQPWITIVSDREMIRHVLYQLFSNAMDFIPTRQKGRIELDMYHRGAQKVLYVRDNGTGFTDNQAKRLFDPFRSSSQDDRLPKNATKLAGVQRVIRRLGGQIWAEGAEGAGGTIYFTYYPAKF